MDNGDWIAGGAVRLHSNGREGGGRRCSCALFWDTFKAHSRYGLDSERNGSVGREAGGGSCKSCKSGKEE